MGRLERIGAWIRGMSIPQFRLLRKIGRPAYRGYLKHLRRAIEEVCKPGSHLPTIPKAYGGSVCAKCNRAVPLSGSREDCPGMGDHRRDFLFRYLVSRGLGHPRSERSLRNGDTLEASLAAHVAAAGER